MHLLLFPVGVFIFHSINLQFTICQEPPFQQTQILQRPRFFKYRRAQSDNPIPLKPSFASVQSSKVFVVKQKGDGDDRGNETFNSLTEAKQENETTSSFVPTSGVRKLCKGHADCYGLREPDEWCPLPSKDQYIDKGCYCNPDIGACVIEKVSKNGTREFTDCASASTSACNGKKKLKAG